MDDLGAKIDISIVVTAHSEGKLLLPCIKSINQSVQYLIDSNIHSEIIIVLDKASAQTKVVANELAKKQKITLVSTDFGNPGESRNFGASVANGDFIALIDGDDLISSNWLLQAYQLSTSVVNQVIVHPEYIFAFGDRPGIFQMKNSNTGFLSYLDLIENNLWASPSFVNRSILSQIPYQATKAEDGFGPEDWVWNIETTAAGFQHLVAEGTVYLYRTTHTSGVNNTHISSLLPTIPIKKLKEHLPLSTNVSNEGISVNRFTRYFRRFLVKTYRICKAPLRPFVRLFPQTARSTYLSLRKAYAKITHQSIEQLSSFLAETTNPLTLETKDKVSGLEQLTAELAWIDPQISTAIESRYYLPVWEPAGGVYGELLAELLEEFSQPRINMIFVPWIGLGGADLVAINYVRSLNHLQPEFRNVLIATWDPEKTNPDYIPGGLDFIQLDQRYWNLSRELQAKLLAQLIVCVRPQAIINVNSPNFYDSIRKYPKQLSSASKIFTCVFCFDRTLTGLPVHTAFDGSRDYLSVITSILTDNSTTKHQLQEIFGIPECNVRVHRSPVSFMKPLVSGVDSEIQLTEKQNRQHLKVLWAHRFDRQKRPDILLKIVEECKHRNVKAEFHIYGSSVMGATDPAMIKLEQLGVTFHGTFTGGLHSVIHEEYDAFLITSEWEGLPTIAIQAIEAGLPVISSNVGGMPDLIPTREHGFLISDLENISEYVQAIKELQQNKELRRKISDKAFKNLFEKYTWEQFLKSVSQDIIGSAEA